MKNKKIKNNLSQLIFLIIILITTIFVMISTVVKAANINIGELTNVTDLVGVLEKRYDAKFTITESAFRSYFDDKAHTALATNHAIYCLAHGKALFDQHERCIFNTDHSGFYGNPESYDMDNYISFEYGGTPTPSTQKFSDYMQSGESDTRKTSSNIRYKITSTDLRDISTNYGRFTGNIIPYAATFEDSAITYYNPGQYAIWGKTGSNGDPNCFNDLYKAGYSVDALESEIAIHGDEPIVEVEKKDDTTGCGTIYENGNYVVGPFKMSDYAYVGSQFAKKYSGRELEVQKDLVGGIESGYITLNNGVELKFGKEVSIRYTNFGDNNRSYSGSASAYWTDASGNQLNFTYDSEHMQLNGEEVMIVYENDQYVLKWLDGRSQIVTMQQSGGDVEYWGVPTAYTCPFPKSEFYIVFPRSATNGATTLSSFSFKYRKTRAEGSGWVANGEYVRTTFSRTDITTGCTTYSDSCHGNTWTDSTGGPRTEICYYCNGSCATPVPNSCTCIGPCKGGHGSHIEYPDPYCASHIVSLTLECIHEHTDCKSCNWLATSTVEYPQPLVGIGEAHVEVTSEDFTYIVNVRLTTDLQINKYIIKAEHVGESGVIFGENSSRSRASNPQNTYAWKKENPVKVERGDKVTYKIDIINAQDQDVSFQIKDVLPAKCADSTFDPSINQWLEVKANQTYTVVVTLRPTADSGIWKNYSEIITKNSGNVDYNRTDYEPSDKRHNGPVVNVAELDGGIINDSDFYEIKEYNVNIDKYIHDVIHEPKYVATSLLDTTIPETDERSVENGMTEDIKENNPVYVEYGDKVIYYIKIYNTTSKYDESINRKLKPYWEPDKVYVNIEDTLPNKYSDLEITVSNGTGAISESTGKFTIHNIMVPPDDVVTVKVTLVVEEHTKGTRETNSVKFIDEIRNINKGPGNGNNVDDKYCVIKNNPMKTETKDYYKLNDYDAFIDKYLYTYDESIRKDNIDLGLSAEQTLVEGDANVLKDFQGRGNLEARERLQDSVKQSAPVPVEKDEIITYQIKATNEAKTVGGALTTSKKPATQVRTDKITDLMELGLQFLRVEAKQYNADGSICSRYNVLGNVPVTSNYCGTISKDGRQYSKYEYNITTDTILNPGEYIVYTVTVKVTQSDLYLYDLDNSAELTILSNINHKADSQKDRLIKNPTDPDWNENISTQQISHEYVRLKDLIIGGKVWLDFNKNGLMDDKIEDYIAQTADGSLFRKDPSKLSTYHNINADAMMKDIVVKLYKEDKTLVRTTKTDSNGIFTFARGEDGRSFYATQYYNLDPARTYSSGTIYERIDKATGKDGNGNYQAGAQYINYYIEYEYDGVIYKATAYSGKDHLNDNGSYKGGSCDHSFETNTDEYLTDNYEKELSPNGKYKYEYDSNANEFVSSREEFNTKYEYITYNKAYTISGESEPGSTLDFDKTDHTSQLLVDHNRKMIARSFIEEISQPNTDEATNYIPLFGYNDGNRTVPYSRYLKFINLGLELREDVDISLTKDVYKVKTTIKGQEMEYNFNTNFIINGTVLDESAVNNNYMRKAPYGIELYESDYKFRNEQYSAIQAVQEYLAKESELNAEVTYRIRIDNKKAHKDDDLKSPDELSGSYDKKNFEDTDQTNLYVKVDEILDLYDENFIKYTSENETIKVRQFDPETGRFAQTDKEIKIAEAWYYKPSDSGTYTFDENSKIYVENGTTGQKYERVELTVSTEAKKGTTNEYLNTNTGNYGNDGYNKLYISGMGEEKIFEDSYLDIFVKYVLDKGNEEITIENDNWEETKSDVSETLYGPISNDETTLIRSLIIKEKRDKANGLGTENIAQINLYSIWYAESDKPASIVDKDSNAGNVGINNDKQTDSADNEAIYEDNIYKTGIDITAKGTANPPKPPEDPKDPEDPPTPSGNSDIRRFLNGHVWDDSRIEEHDKQFTGNGLRRIGGDNKNNDAQTNLLVQEILEKTEDIDIAVPGARVEFVEIVETAADRYYEILPTDVSCDYLQHIRTDADGYYQLYGYTPGKYVVRFTYGDELTEYDSSEGDTTTQNYMYLFNGQDYKSTKYTMQDAEKGTVLDDNIVLYNPASNEADIDKIIASLEAEEFNDARDDEIRRLEVNGYSEIMDNMMAEILQGKANEKGLTNNSDANTAEELKALVSNTWMYAETIPFTVRAEKISDTLKAQVPPIIENTTYASREQLETQLTDIRDFKIENIDFGIQYRPENAVQLEKEIKEIKVVTESGETVVDLHFYTDYNNTENGSAKTHYLDTEKSVGLDMIQFISNEYVSNGLVSALISEKDDLQGFVYINYDVDIQQGATIEVTYEFIAENHGEVDRIAKNLDNIRYQKNAATVLLGDNVIKGNDIVKDANQNGVINYRANITAANDMIDNLYAEDDQQKGIYYRTSPKVLTALSGRGQEANSNSKGVSTKKLSYYGYYTGYENYTGQVTDFDTVAELKFNKILDYVDKDMLYLDNTKGKETLNKTWSVLDNTYKEYYSTIDWARSDLGYVSRASKDVYKPEQITEYINNKIESLNIVSSLKEIERKLKNTDGFTGSQMFNTEIGNISGASIDPEGYIYENMVVSTDTGMYTDIYTENVDFKVPDGTNPSLSRFLMPMTFDTEEYNESRGKIQLTVSKAISAETSDDELQYENIAEIVEFTTLTGRRTNFAITIGNVDLRKNTPDPSTPKPTPPNKEYPQAVPEPDQSAAEVITLIPPQGLMRKDRVIREVVEIAKTGSQVVVIIAAIVVIGMFGTTFAIRKYNKRRIK